MQNLIESVMTYNYYPNQTPAWEGWEYIPNTEADVQALAKAAGFSSHEGAGGSLLAVLPFYKPLCCRCRWLCRGIGF